MVTRNNVARLRRAACALPIVAVVGQASAVGAQAPAPAPDSPDGGSSSERLVAGSLEFVGTLTDSKGVRRSGGIGAAVHVHPEDQVRLGLTPQSATLRLPEVVADSSGRFSVQVDRGAPAFQRMIALGARLQLVLAATIGPEQALSFTPLSATGDERAGTASRESSSAQAARTIELSTLPAGVEPAPVVRGASVAAVAAPSPPGLCTQVGAPVRISNGTVTVGASRFAFDTHNWAIGWSYKRTNTTSTSVGVSYGVNGNFPTGSVSFSASGSSSVGRDTSLEGSALTAANGSGIGRKHNITVSRYLTRWNCLVSPSIPPPNNYVKAYTIHSGSWIADFAAQDIGSPAACTLTGSAGGTRNWTEIGPGSSIVRDSQSSTTYGAGFTGDVSYQGLSASVSLSTTTGFSTNSKVTVANTLTSGNKRLCGYTANRKPLFDNTQFVANPGLF